MILTLKMSISLAICPYSSADDWMILTLKMSISLAFIISLSDTPY